jgi:hypothetical protein
VVVGANTPPFSLTGFPVDKFRLLCYNLDKGVAIYGRRLCLSPPHPSSVNSKGGEALSMYEALTLLVAIAMLVLTIRRDKRK